MDTRVAELLARLDAELTPDPELHAFCKQAWQRFGQQGGAAGSGVVPEASVEAPPAADPPGPPPPQGPYGPVVPAQRPAAEPGAKAVASVGPEAVEALADLSEAPLLRRAGPRSRTSGGLRALHSYNNLRSQPANTCGQAAIATMVDFFGLNPYGLRRSVRSSVDGRLHYDNDQLVGRVYGDYGPNWPWPNGVTTRETILLALRAYGLRCEELYPAAFADGAEPRRWLVEWIVGRRQPVIVLVDPKGAGIHTADFKLHWCMVSSVGGAGVRVASWQHMFNVPWERFLHGWHCWFVPYPNNYLQIRVWR